MFFIVKYISFFFPHQRKIFRIIFCQFTTKICWFKTDTIGENINIIVQVKINKKKKDFFPIFFWITFTTAVVYWREEVLLNCCLCQTQSPIVFLFFFLDFLIKKNRYLCQIFSFNDINKQFKRRQKKETRNKLISWFFLNFFCCFIFVLEEKKKKKFFFRILIVNEQQFVVDKLLLNLID